MAALRDLPQDLKPMTLFSPPPELTGQLLTVFQSISHKPETSETNKQIELTIFRKYIQYLMAWLIGGSKDFLTDLAQQKFIKEAYINSEDSSA